MMVKKANRGKCPFRELQPCSDKCAFFRKGIRYKDGSNEALPFEECVVNIIADNLEAMHSRTIGLQQEMGETKNIMALKTLVDVGVNTPEHLDMLKRHIVKILMPPDPAKQIKG